MDIRLTAINSRLSLLKRELEVLTTQESSYFFAGNSIDYMIALSKVKEIKQEIAELEILSERLSSQSA